MPISAELAELAEALGLSTEYLDAEGTLREVPESTILAIVSALDIDVSPGVTATLEAVRLRAWRLRIQPTVVARSDCASAVPIHVPRDTQCSVRLELEEGSVVPLAVPTQWEETRIVDGATMVRGQLTIRAGLPEGVHRIILTTGNPPDNAVFYDDVTCSLSTLLVAPPSIPLPESLGTARAVGIAAQLYQLRSRQSWGMGDFRDLGELSHWAGRELGADFVLVNPLHATEPKPPVEPSPYLPISRQFSSPLYLCLEDLDGFSTLSANHRSQIAAAGGPARAIASTDFIDRDKICAAKRAALQVSWNAGIGGRHSPEFRDFCEAGGENLRLFALWCSLAARHGSRWRAWPEELHHPYSPAAQEYAEQHEEELRFEQWIQWLVEVQSQRAQERALGSGMRLGVVHDLAVGAHPDGADTWIYGPTFAQGVTVGAPPDMYNQRGQDWSQPPLSPLRLAEQGYSTFRDLVRQAVRHSGGVRIDHILGLFRLWWIPAGAPPTEGTYVRYDFEAMLAVLAIEAKRAGAVVIGEDLGTVAPGVREELSARGILGTSVLWFEQQEDGTPIDPRDYRRLCLASVTTHDLPPTAGYLTSVQVEIRQRLGQLVMPVEQERERATAEIECFRRELVAHGLCADTASTDELVTALHAYLSRCPSLLVAVSLADMTGDYRPINIPGTSTEYPNWCLPLTGPNTELVQLEDLMASPRSRRIFQALET